MPRDQITHARDEQAARAYLEKHNISELFREQTQRLLLNKPANPVAFLHRDLGERLGDSGDAQGAVRALDPEVCRLSLSVEVEGHGGQQQNRRSFSTLIACRNISAVARAYDDAAQVLHDVLWSAAEASSREAAEQKIAGAGIANYPKGSEGGAGFERGREGAAVGQGSDGVGVTRLAMGTQRMGQSTATVLQSLLEGIPEDTFAHPDIDGSSGVASHTSGLTPEDWQRALGAEEGIDKDELQALFHEFDADKSGRVSLAQFKAGLQTLQPRVGELDVLKGVLRNVDLNNMLASRLAVILSKKRAAQEQGLSLDTHAICRYLTPDDISTAWQEGLSDDLKQGVREQLHMIQQGEAVPNASTMNAKFADTTFEGHYGNLDEFLAGITEKVGLPAQSVYAGMEMQCCHVHDSADTFHVPNNGGYHTTPSEEWAFVLNPDLSKTYPGNRCGVVLAAYLVAHGAARKEGGERLDMHLDAAALEQV